MMNVPGDPNLAAALAQVQAMTAGMISPIDRSDARMAPIEGVTFEQFVAASGALIREAPATSAAADAVAHTQGVPAGRWLEVQTAWNGRMTGDLQFAQHFGSALMASGAMAGASGVAGSPALAGPLAPAPVSGGAGSGGNDAVAKLERLGKLHESGTLTDEEFARMKASVLDSI